MEEQLSARMSPNLRADSWFHVGLDEASDRQLDDETNDLRQERGAVRQFFLQTIQKALPATPFQQQLLADAIRCKLQLVSKGSSLSVRAVATTLAAMGYHVIVRRAVRKGRATYFEALRHETIVVKSPSNIGGPDSELLVEVDFRDSLTIGRASQRYLLLLSVLPEVFVGSKDSLVALVSLAADEAANSFKTANMSIPPWRRAQTLATKWAPELCEDFVVSDSDSDDWTVSPVTVLRRQKRSNDCAVRKSPVYKGHLQTENPHPTVYGFQSPTQTVPHCAKREGYSFGGLDKLKIYVVRPKQQTCFEVGS